MCRIDYKKHGLFVCSSNLSCFTNVVFSRFHGKYLFMQFTCSKKYMHTMNEKIIILKSKHSILHEIMLEFFNDYIRNPTLEDEFSCLMLGDDEEKRFMGINRYADVYICVSDSNYDTFEYGISTARLQNKFPMLYYVC